MNCDERPNQEKSELHLEAPTPKLVKYAQQLFGSFFFYCVLNPQSNFQLSKTQSVNLNFYVIQFFHTNLIFLQAASI